MALFRASTKITLGDGLFAKFWHDNWSGRGPLSATAPELFKIASCKNRSVHKELLNDNWIRSVARISTAAQLREFIDVASSLHDIHLDPHLKDSITWLWMANGEYSASSAYHIQFQGSFPKFDSKKIWCAYVEPKAKLFAWLVLHKRILTADLLAKKGWPHDPTCQLCHNDPETADHLCKDCPFTKDVWNTMSMWAGGQGGTQPQDHCSIDCWWNAFTSDCTRKMAKERSGRIIYVMWNVWKERNRRIFNATSLSYLEVAHLAFEELTQISGALRPQGTPSVVHRGVILMWDVCVEDSLTLPGAL
jgi:hypothetical protein